jgi:L-aminopeptidase/D-esterase-like protein
VTKLQTALLAALLAGLALVELAERRVPANASVSTQAQSTADGITGIPGILVGHFTLKERPTGCTVILAQPAATGAVDVRGGAPGTREVSLLAPENSIEKVDAIVLAGGSAFGLDAATGVMRFLAEKGLGYQTSAGAVPIVPAAILFDLAVGGRPDIRPDASCGYEAARQARPGVVEEGSVGAGAGATVGKLLGTGRAMKGGVGTAALSVDGLIVGALVAVNANGTVIDPRTTQPIAGVRSIDGRSLEDPFALIRRGVASAGPARENTTIGVVATNARLTKPQALKVVGMAHDGLARSIVPSHSPSDGDTLFALATGGLTQDVNVGAVGALAAEAVAEAVVRAVRAAKGLSDYPAAAEIR